MKGAFEKILGKTISGVLYRKNKSPPELQFYLVFEDGTYFEIYGHGDLTGAKGLDRGNIDHINKIRFPPGETLMILGEHETDENIEQMPEEEQTDKDLGVEGVLIVSLGPPGDKELLSLYDEFQDIYPGEEADQTQWSIYESDVIRKLFEKTEGSSIMEELLSEVVGAVLVIGDYSSPTGMHRGKWTRDIVIKPSNVAAASMAGNKSWPPKQEQLDMISLMLLSVLKRDWVGCMTMHE